MQVIQTIHEMQSFALEHRRQGKRLGLVPTMGNLHAGHRTLMREARPQCDLLVTSIFVNPTQFGPNEDYQRYPRTLEADCGACSAEGVDVVFAPSAEEMYRDDQDVVVEVKGWSEQLCGASRPGHFRGVTTVVLKLFMICQPDLAAFGWKDAQQFLILRRMVRALNIPVRMVGVETMREADGLAMSSRNQYLSAEERRQAPALYQALSKAWDRSKATPHVPAGEILEAIRAHLSANTSADIDYVQAVSMRTLQPLETIEADNTLIAAAIRFPSARLIDNIRI